MTQGVWNKKAADIGKPEQIEISAQNVTLN